MPVLTTWNLENLYQPGGEFGPKTKSVYDEKLDYVAARIETIGPDVLAVQEIGDPEALDELTGRLPGTWHTVLSEHPDARGIRVGFLSRGSIATTTHVTTLPEPLRPVQSGDGPDDAAEALGRGALHVRTAVDGRDLDLVTCHLKSKLLTYPGGRFNPKDEDERARFGAYALYRRTAEAAAIRVHVNALLAEEGRSVAVLGDLNDTQLAATTQLMYGPTGSQLGTAGFDRPDKGDRSRLWNVAAKIPEEQRFSRIHEGDRELIDHILLSHALVEGLESAESFTDDIQGIGNNPSARRSESVPDHAPVTVRIG
ncbi:endonuclease/exonuclease/phosphatase [Arthrobacter crystallopoietes BAB-32]|uniref:Endonuclease/exonuclease/phosphatase n=1 Tax=Arthrobacter crystallopoietes BAB-32 TaxID=1246476 RepID=N1UZ23_9MICC|nr:endonuclease/exonuclease/phosphatase family protein [Arthrobacter crystallopoietes]EMY35651.1 endonuclease/exonuclease/phosphatase [Arthrobacter crystallopoietes BAB-32]